MFDGGESLPLAGEENTTLSDDPELLVDLSAGEVFLLENPRVFYRSDQTLCISASSLFVMSLSSLSQTLEAVARC